MEVIVVVAIIAIASTISIRNIISWAPQHRLGVAVRDMITTFQMARIKAIKNNTDIIVAINVGTDSYTVFQDDGAGSAPGPDGIPLNALNWVRDGAERVYDTEPLPAGINITAANFAGAPAVRFNARGFPLNAVGISTGGTVNFTNNQGSGSSNQTVTLFISGSAR